MRAHGNLSETELRQLCHSRGIAIRRRGAGYELIGPGVEIFTADLSQLRASDLQAGDRLAGDLAAPE